MRALRRRFPQIYHSHRKLAIKQDDVMVLRSDFADAMKAIAPAAHRYAPRAHKQESGGVISANRFWIHSCPFDSPPSPPPHSLTFPRTFHRAASTFAAALPPFLSPLLQGSLEKAIKAINHQGMLPLPSTTTAAGEEEDDEMVLEVMRTDCLLASSDRNGRPRFLMA